MSQSGATISAANFVHAPSAPKTPRPTGDDASQKPKMRKHGMIASFVFEFDDVLRERIRGPRERERRREREAAEPAPDEPEAEHAEQVERDRRDVRRRQRVPPPAPAGRISSPGMYAS